MNPISYTVNIHDSPRILMIPGSRVTGSGTYCPSAKLQDRIQSMWSSRNPRRVGDVSEKMAVEIIRGGIIRIGRESWDLTCKSLEDIAREMDWIWKPSYGIHCDDIGTIAVNKSSRLLFVTECKGTIQKSGISRDMEAKMFYQIARTFEKMDRTMKKNTGLELGGLISVVVNHHSRVITINVNDRSSSFAGGLPDPWMYPGKDSDQI